MENETNRFLMLKNRFSKSSFWFITAVSVIVPKRLRAAWKQEWEAELRHHETRLLRWRQSDWQTRADLLRRSCGSLQDALVLQPQRWEDEMIQDLRFGIRMALGASRGAVYQLILGQGMRVVAMGLVTGLIGAFALTRWMETLLFEVRASDPLTYAVIAIALASVALFACFIPARRATKTDPMNALRYD
jgi:hypothetical protein